jgi:hypothetical protein
MKYRLSANVDEVARQVNRTVGEVRTRVIDEMEKLSISSHAFIVAKANAELNGYLREAFLGKDHRNLRWEKVSDQIWAVTLDESARWIEEGRQPTFMRWLLDHNPKAKVAKDGSRYAYIPFSHLKSGQKPDLSGDPKAAYEAIVRRTLRENKINLRKVERNLDGTPKFGVLRKFSMEPPGSREQFPGLFSQPRSPEVAKKIGLRPHDGIYHLKGLMLVQRPGKKKGSVVREAVTIRTISSKHEAEGNRWIYPQVRAFGGLQAAHEYAQLEWAKIVELLKRELG